jgi:hypothetical protein
MLSHDSSEYLLPRPICRLAAANYRPKAQNRTCKYFGYLGVTILGDRSICCASAFCQILGALIDDADPKWASGPHLRGAPSHGAARGEGICVQNDSTTSTSASRNNHLSRRTSRVSKCPILARGRLPLGKGGQTVTAEPGGNQPEGRRVR